MNCLDIAKKLKITINIACLPFDESNTKQKENYGNIEYIK